MPGCTMLPDGQLLIQGGTRGDIFGGFRGHVGPLKVARRYKVTVLATLSGIGSPRHQTWVQIDGGGDDDHFRVIADVHPQPDGKCRYEMVVNVQKKEAVLDVLLVRCPAGRIVVERTEVEELPAAKSRWCRVCAFHDYLAYHPGRTALEDCREFAVDIDRAVKESPHPLDLLVLPEACNHVGVEGPHWISAVQPDGLEVAELSRAAARNRVWIVAGLYLYDGDTIYNSAVLLDRHGQIAGVYRKVQLPNQEWTDGFRPGNDLPVFDTDFGRIGIMICHDTMYPEVARGLALRGAELIAVPIWGGQEVSVRSRAVENGVWVVCSGFDYPSQIIDPAGAMIAEAKLPRGTKKFLYHKIDLANPPIQPWYGVMKDLQYKERRDDLYVRTADQPFAALPRWNGTNE
jgi:predicted amidohydrolase